MKKKLVFIGNSIVNGFPYDQKLCFVSLVRRATGYDVINKGINGETTSDILARFDRDVLASEPDAVFIMTGTNDFIYGQTSVEQAFENLKKMEFMALNNARSITPIFITPLPVDAAMASKMWIAGADYDNVNQCLTELAEAIRSSGNEFIDLNKLYRECGKYHDGIHPLPEGHRFIADVVSDYIKRSSTI